MPTASITVLILGFLGSALFSGLETGIISIHRVRLWHLMRRRVRGARVIYAFLNNPDHFLGTILVGNNLSNVTVSVVAASLATGWLGPWGRPISAGLVTIVLLVGCEYLPKIWFRCAPRRSLHFARVLWMAGIVFYPVSKAASLFSRLLLPSPSADDGGGGGLTREDIRYLSRESAQAGKLSPDERRMLQGVFALSEKRCREAMVPRDEMVVVEEDADVETVLRRAREQDLSRLPVHQAQTDSFIGVLHVRDVLIDEEPGGRRAGDFARPPQFVSGDLPVYALLPRMRLNRSPLALVTDARSRVIGLVTMTDLLETVLDRD